MAAVLVLAGCGSSGGGGNSGATTTAPSSQSSGSSMPQNNGADADADNSGGPDDGDGGFPSERLPALAALVPLGAVDVRSYLDRIGYSRPTDATLETLFALHRAHMLSVPFENLDIHLGRRNVLDPAANVAKIVHRRRGGWCYELNGSFAELLRALGFRVTLLGAAVYGERGLTQDLAHLALRVDLDAAWLVDVGFGDSFTTPVELDTPVEQRRDGGGYRCVADADHLVLERDGDPSYRFSLQPRSMDDFAGMCDHQQTSPESVFTTRRTCSLATETGRVTLTDLRLIETRDGHREERDLAGEVEWRSVLAERFGVVLDA